MTQQEAKQKAIQDIINSPQRERICKFWYDNSREAFGANATAAIHYEWYLEHLEQQEAPEENNS